MPCMLPSEWLGARLADSHQELAHLHQEPLLSLHVGGLQVGQLLTLGRQLCLQFGDLAFL